MDTRPLRYILYARRSSDRDDLQTLSLDQQVQVLRQLALTRELDVVEELTESASAKLSGRPVFRELVKRLEAGNADGILVWRLDRLARNLVDGATLIDLLARDRFKEIVTPEATYSSTGDSKFMLAMLFGAAAKYTDDLADAVRRGNRDVLDRGKVPGPVPLGYVKTHIHERAPGPGTVIPDPERFELVKGIFRQVLGGNTNVRDLWRRALTSGLTIRPTENTLARPVSLATIHMILRNSFYTGQIERAGVVYKGEHPPMLTRAEFDRVQASIGRKRAQIRPPVHHDFLYHGLLRCPCGRSLVGESHTKRDLTWVYYRCSRRKRGQHRCPERPVPEPELTNAIASQLDRVTVDPTIRDWAFEAIAWWADGEPSPEKVVRQTKSALARAESELATLTDLLVNGTVVPDEYRVRRVNLLGRIEHLREALAKPVERLEAWRTIRDEKRKNGLHLGREFRDGDVATKRKILTRVATEVVVRAREPELTLRAPFVLRVTNETLMPSASVR
ncbi:MAG: recombinase family protein [Planctomycetes bacterium]|nr:recombinase family protein [Planctomycetota bacterium]